MLTALAVAAVALHATVLVVRPPGVLFPNTAVLLSAALLGSLIGSVLKGTVGLLAGGAFAIPFLAATTLVYLRFASPLRKGDPEP